MIYGVFLLNLAVTVLAEGLVLALLFRRRDFVYYSVLCNLLTNPLLNLTLLLVVRLWGIEYYPAALIALEIAVLLAEAFVLRLLCRFPPLKALLVSGLTNAVSFICGLLIQGLITG